MIQIDNDRLPSHVSYSSLTEWLSCGWKYYLSRVQAVEESPAWWFFGGSAVHVATEIYDRNNL